MKLCNQLLKASYDPAKVIRRMRVGNIVRQLVMQVGD
jgi:hypothetical protein